ncbi:MAG: hypothetical protein ACXV3V_05075 [Actinomycetes bacterium]
MTSVRVTVYDRSLAFIAHVPRRRNVKWQDELNTPGVGSFELQLDDAVLSAHPTLLDDFNVVQISINGTAVKSFVIEAKDRVNAGPGEGSDRWVTVSGRGVLCLLGNAVVYPEYPLRYNTADARSFDYGSKDGGWRVTSDWVTPAGVTQGSSSSIRGTRYPLYWPDHAAQWLWSSNPNAASAAGANYFRGSFTLSTATRVRIYAAGDNELELQLDGEVVIRSNNWRHTSTYTVDLPAGTHLVAAKVTNYSTATGTNPAGFICSVGRVDRNNKLLQWLLRGTTSTFKVRGYGQPPGWYGASILKTLISEAQARGVEGFSPITFGFTDTADTSGAAWTGRHDRDFDIGNRDLLDVLTQLTETDFDVDMSPALVLNAWKQRGSDLSNTVRLLPAKGVTQASGSSNASRVKTRALVRHGAGWIEYVDGAASSYGRRETGLVVGSTYSDSQAQTFSVAAFNDLGKPEITLPVTTTSAAGPQPYVDYTVGDIITAPGLLGTPSKGRLMSLSVEENTGGDLKFSHELYPEP